MNKEWGEVQTEGGKGVHSEGGDQEAPCHMIQPIGTSMTQQTEAANGRPVNRRIISNQGILDKGALGYIRKRLLSRFHFFSHLYPSLYLLYKFYRIDLRLYPLIPHYLECVRSQDFAEPSPQQTS